MNIRSESLSLLRELRTNKSIWPDRLAFTSVGDVNNFDEGKYLARCLAMLALHAEPGSALSDLPLARYILEQETRFEDKEGGYFSALSLACSLIARTRVLENGAFFDIWVARHINYDTSILVDVRWMYYLTGGLDAAKGYIESITVEEVLATAGSPRKQWWNSELQRNDHDEQKTLNSIQMEILERIEHDRKYMDDDEIIDYVEGSWSTNTNRWAGSLLTAAECE
jgi:hypothetical protein